VPHLDGLLLARLGQASQRICAHSDQHPEAGSEARRDLQQALVRQGRQAPQHQVRLLVPGSESGARIRRGGALGAAGAARVVRGADRGCRDCVEGAGEDAQAGEERTLLGREQRIAPVERPAHRPLALRQVARTIGEESQPHAQARQQRVGGKELDPRGGQLDGQRQAVEGRADGRDRRERRAGGANPGDTARARATKSCTASLRVGSDGSPAPSMGSGNGGTRISCSP